MNKLDSNKINQHIRDGLTSIPQTEADRLWKEPVQKASGEEWFLEGTDKKASVKTRKTAGWISVAAACFAICLLCILPASLQTSAMIYLDVNPSLSISINKNEKVLDVVANNADGEQILDGMDLSHTDLNTTVNALIGSMVKQGYLSDAQNTVLVSVDGKDAAQTSALRTEVSDDIYNSLQTLLGTGTVLDQSVKTTDSLSGLAETYQISPGKAWLIERLVSTNPDFGYDDLAALPISELIQHLKDAGVDLHQYVNYHGILDDDWFDDLFDAFDDLDDIYDDIDDTDDIDDLNDTDDNDLDDADDDPDDDEDRYDNDDDDGDDDWDDNDDDNDDGDDDWDDNDDDDD